MSGDTASRTQAKGPSIMFSQAENDANTRREPPAWLRRLRFPVLLVAMFAVLTASGALNSALSGLGVLEMVVGLGTAAAALFCYHRLSRFVEQRQTVTELERTGARSGLLRGAALGAAMFLVTMLIILIFGGWDHVEGGSFWGFLASIGMMASAAAIEELLFRGVIFRIVEERAGTWPALALSAVIFGLVHLVNPNATLWGAISIAIEAGILFGAAYAATRSLWLPIGLHFAWNLAESGVFGTTVSGSSDGVGGLLHTTLSGPTVLTGGTFGPEASLVAMLVCAVPAAIFLRRAAREGKIVRHQGRRQR
jgi:membrane protease YdiL (CAAX protease family)